MYVVHSLMYKSDDPRLLLFRIGRDFSSKKLNGHLWHAGLAAGYLHAAWKTHQPETVFAPRWEMRQAASLQKSRSSAVIPGLVDAKA